MYNILNGTNITKMKKKIVKDGKVYFVSKLDQP